MIASFSLLVPVLKECRLSGRLSVLCFHLTLRGHEAHSEDSPVRLTPQTRFVQGCSDVERVRRLELRLELDGVDLSDGKDGE